MNGKDIQRLNCLDSIGYELGRVLVVNQIHPMDLDDRGLVGLKCLLKADAPMLYRELCSLQPLENEYCWRFACTFDLADQILMFCTGNADEHEVKPTDP